MIKYRKVYIFFLALFIGLVATRGRFFPDDYYVAEEVAAGEADLFYVFLWPVFFVIFSILAHIRGFRFRGLPGVLWVLFFVAFLSSINSDLLLISIRRTLAFVLSSLCIFYIVCAAEKPGHIIRGVAYGVLPLLVVSVVGAIVAPHYAVHWASPDLVGDWKGVFTHKNPAAFVGALAFLVCVYFLKRDKGGLFNVSLALISAFFVFKTNSMLISIMLPISYIFGMAVSKGRVGALKVRIRGGVVLSVIVGLCITFATIYFPKWPELVGTTLNFRTEIWETLMSAQAGYEWLGRGYGAVHGVGESSVFWNYGEFRIQTLGHGHSGQLDVYAATGVIGLLGVNFFLFYPLYRLRPLLETGLRLERFFFVTLIVLLVFRSFVESNLMSSGSLDWVIGVISLFAILRWFSRDNARKSSCWREDKAHG